MCLIVSSTQVEKNLVSRSDKSRKGDRHYGSGPGSGRAATQLALRLFGQPITDTEVCLGLQLFTRWRISRVG